MYVRLRVRASVAPASAARDKTADTQAQRNAAIEAKLVYLKARRCQIPDVHQDTRKHTYVRL